MKIVFKLNPHQQIRALAIKGSKALTLSSQKTPGLVSRGNLAFSTRATPAKPEQDHSLNLSGDSRTIEYVGSRTSLVEGSSECLKTLCLIFGTTRIPPHVIIVFESARPYPPWSMTELQAIKDGRVSHRNLVLMAMGKSPSETKKAAQAKLAEGLPSRWFLMSESKRSAQFSHEELSRYHSLAALVTHS